jgi:hypothetical protein
MKIDSDTTYLVQSEQDDSVLLALDLKCSDGMVEWFDSARDRAFEILSKDEEEHMLCVRTDASEYRFRRLSLDAYRAHVQDKVVGQPHFNSTDEVQAYYRAYVR